MEMTVTRGLAELKLLDKRITKEITMFNPVGLIQTRVNIVTGTNKTKEDYENEVKSQYQSITDLIQRYSDIKAAIIKSNAITEIKINGQSMTVAEGIEKKNSIQYIDKLQKKINEAGVGSINARDQHNAKLKDQVENMLLNNYGKDRKANSDEYDAISKPFLEANELKIIDPIEHDKTNKKLSNEIQTFVSEIDYILSESNAKTKIKI